MKKKILNITTSLTFALAILLLIVDIAMPDTLADVTYRLQAPFSVSVSTINFGNIPVGHQTIKKFTALNDHFYPIRIEKIATSCGCTSAVTSSTSVASFRRGTFTVGVTPNTVGEGVKTISIRTNHGNQEVSIKFNAIDQIPQLR
jgi:hypothetical protein